MEGIIDIEINGKVEHLKITMWQVQRANELMQQKPENPAWVNASFIVAGLENYYRKLGNGACPYDMDFIVEWVDDYSAEEKNFATIKNINEQITQHHLYRTVTEAAKKNSQTET